MSKRIINPFTPQKPIDNPEYFFGRNSEVDSIIDVLYQTAHENPEHAIITGDRGIGKSSLLVQTKRIAEGDTTLIEKFNIDTGGIDNFNFKSIWIDTVENQSAEEVARYILSNLKRSITILSKIDFSLDLFGVQIAKKEEEAKANPINEVVGNFVQEMKKVSKKAMEEKLDGIIIFIDEIDRMDMAKDLPTFFKLVTESFSRNHINNIIFFFAGISGAVQQMKNIHPSISRTFKDIVLHKLSKPEIELILINGFDKVGFTYSDDVLNSIGYMSAGFPEPVHLLGGTIIRYSVNNNLDTTSLTKGIEDIIQNKKNNELKNLLEEAGSGKYQQILKAMASNENINVPLSYIDNYLDIKQSEYSMNINKLCERNIIKKYSRGIYSFVDPLLKEYIKMFGVLE